MATHPASARQVTSGGKDLHFPLSSEMIRSSPVTSTAFLPSKFKRPGILANSFQGFFTQVSLHRAIVAGVDGYAGLVLASFCPLSTSVESPWTMLRAGLITALFNIGIRTTLKVIAYLRPRNVRTIYDVMDAQRRVLVDYGSGTEPVMRTAFTKQERGSRCYVLIMGTALARR
ncbi:hypothetical protein F4778DRAFT_778616 [Xylariomycetidae sp. FL2044]|nr:hypothetical protein F4778DRAFT_778616 [Xylariomycetidae sp. FL2044]